MRRTIGLTLLSLGLIAGCGKDEFADATPQTSALQMELTGGSSEGLTAQSADWGAQRQALTGQLPEWLQHTKDAIAALNAGVAKVIAPVEQAVAANVGTLQSGDTKLYGPTDKDGATWRFYIKRIDVSDFGWALQAKPIGGDDSLYVTVMAGLIKKGTEPHHGEGILGADLDKLATVDSTFHGSGQLLVGFAHVSGYKVLAYGLHNFSPDVSQFETVDAIFSGWKGPDGVARVRLAAYANIADTPTDAKELSILRARWLPGVGGRADALATAGDIPAGHVYVANACWDRDQSDVDGFYALRDCTIGSLTINCTIVKTAGQLTNCAQGLGDEELPSSDPMDPTQEKGSPVQPSIPAQMPTGN
jgi:hypothetical protein